MSDSGWKLGNIVTIKEYSCERCSGAGSLPLTVVKSCPDCNGSGKILYMNFEPVTKSEITSIDE